MAVRAREEDAVTTNRPQGELHALRRTSRHLYLTDADGGAVLNNAGTVVPTMISETSQGGAIANLVVCATSAQDVPAGSVFHFHLIGRGK